jgi:hypothetical protein
MLAYYVSIPQAKNITEAYLLLGDCQTALKEYGEAVVAYAAAQPPGAHRATGGMKKVRERLDRMKPEGILLVNSSLVGRRHHRLRPLSPAQKLLDR